MIVPAADVMVAASVTSYRPGTERAVGVCGSHGATNSVAYGARAGLVGLVVNDAGIGRNRAGISGLAVADRVGFAVVAVSNLSARIGDGDDTMANGIVSAVNQSAEALGVEVGMTTAEAVGYLRNAPASAPWPDADQPRRTLLALGPVEVLCADSAASITPDDLDRILVSGSHGGMVAGRTLINPVRAVFLNDAGRGKGDAGILRILTLASEGVPAAAVAHTSAMIGNGADTLEHGIISMANVPAHRLGLKPEMPVRAAVELLADTFSRSVSDAGPRPRSRER